MNQQMQASLLRGPGGKVVLLEVPSDFAKVLSSLIDMPGRKLACLVSEKKAPLVNLAKSMAALGSESTDTAMSGPSLNFQDFSHADFSVLHAVNVERINVDSRVEKFVSTKPGWNSGIVLDPMGQDSFEITIQLESPSSSNYVMVSIAPKDITMETICSGTLHHQSRFYLIIHNETGLYAQDGTSVDGGFAGNWNAPFSANTRIKMKFTGAASPSLWFSVNGRDYVKADFKSSIPAAKQNTYFPVVLLQQVGTAVIVDELPMGMSDSRMTASCVVKPKVLIMNDLTIRASCSRDAFEAAAEKFGAITLTDLYWETVTLTPEHLRDMISLAFQGREDVLDHMFAGSLCAQKMEVSTSQVSLTVKCNGSDSSFEDISAVKE